MKLSPAQKQTRALVQAAAAVCEDKKAQDTRILELDSADSGLSDFFLVTSATNERQAIAIADEIELRLKREFGVYPNSVEGRRNGEWILLDYVDFVVHVFLVRAPRLLRHRTAAQVGAPADAGGVRRRAEDRADREDPRRADQGSRRKRHRSAKSATKSASRTKKPAKRAKTVKKSAKKAAPRRKAATAKKQRCATLREKDQALTLNGPAQGDSSRPMLKQQAS